MIRPNDAHAFNGGADFARVIVNQVQRMVAGVAAHQQFLHQKDAHFPRANDGDIDAVWLFKGDGAAGGKQLVLLFADVLIGEAGGQRHQEAGAKRGHRDEKRQMNRQKQPVNQQKDEAACHIRQRHQQIYGGVGVAPHLPVDAQQQPAQEGAAHHDPKKYRNIVECYGNIAQIKAKQKNAIRNGKKEDIDQEQQQYPRFPSKHLTLHLLSPSAPANLPGQCRLKSISMLYFKTN